MPTERSGRWGPYRRASPPPARHRPGARSARRDGRRFDSKADRFRKGGLNHVANLFASLPEIDCPAPPARSRAAAPAAMVALRAPAGGSGGSDRAQLFARMANALYRGIQLRCWKRDRDRWVRERVRRGRGLRGWDRRGMHRHRLRDGEVRCEWQYALDTDLRVHSWEYG